MCFGLRFEFYGLGFRVQGSDFRKSELSALQLRVRSRVCVDFKSRVYGVGCGGRFWGLEFGV